MQIPLSLRGRRRARFALAAFLILVFGFACKPEPPPIDDEEDNEGNIVIHAGTKADWREYRMELAIWTILLNLIIPQHPDNAKALSVQGSGSLLHAASDLAGPSFAYEQGSEVFGFFAGGVGPVGFTASRNARLVRSPDVVEQLQMITARSEQAMVELPGSRVLITGGYGAASPPRPISSAEIFTFSSRNFAATGSMNVERADHAMARLGDGRVLVTGGLVPTGAGPVTIDVSSTEIFNPPTGTFANGPSMTTARFNHSAITLDDGRILVLGGNLKRSAEVYATGTNSFTALPDMAVVHGNGHVAVKLNNGKVLVTGGDAAVIQPTAVVELFDPATNTFSTVGNMTSPRMLHFALLMPDGRVVIGAGRGADGSDLATMEVYDPVANTFTPIPNLPAALSDVPAAFVRPGGN